MTTRRVGEDRRAAQRGVLARDPAAAAQGRADAGAVAQGWTKSTAAAARDLVSFSLPSRSPNRPSRHPNRD
jgi:hypothetical protein